MLRYLAENPGATVGAFGALLAASIALYVRWRNSFGAASAAFRAAFAETLTTLRRSDRGTVSILRSTFSSHEAAVAEFSRHLGWYARRRFLRAWRTYHQVQGVEYLEQYSPFVAAAGGVARRDRRALAIQRIEVLLSYAKP
jgi:hypothetical protein